MSVNPLSSHHSVSQTGGAASAAPRLVLSQLATFGNVVGSTATFKGKILDPTKIADLKMKYQQFYKLVGDFFNIEGEVYSFILDPETQGEMKGFLKVRSNVWDPSHPTAPPKEVVQLVNIPLLALQLDDDQFQQLDKAYQDVCQAQLGRRAPNGLKKSFNQQFNTQSLESTPFLGSEMLKGSEVRAFLNVKNAQEMKELLDLEMSEEEIEKIQEQLEMTKGLVREGDEPAVLLALFDIDPARLRESFQDNEPEEKHWYSRLGLGKDTARQNSLMASRMIDKIIAECQAFSLDPEVQQEASRFFAKKENLIISQKQYHPPGVYDLDILFHGEKKEWKTHEEWINHFNRFSLEDKEKLDLLNRLKEWRGQDYREKLANEVNSYQKDAHFHTEEATDEELDSFLTGIAPSDEQKAQKLKAALKASLKEGKTLKDLSLQQLVEKVGGSDLAREVQKASKTAQAQAGRGQLPAQLAPQHPGSRQILGRSAQGGSSASVGGSVPQGQGASGSIPSSRRSSVDSSAGVYGASSGSSSSLDSSRSASPVASSGGSSDSGRNAPPAPDSSRSASPAPQAALSQEQIQQMQAEYNWIEEVYNTLHQGEVLNKGILSSLYGFEIGKDRSFLEDLFVQRRQLDPKIEPGKFVETFEDSLKWAQSMLDQHLEEWITTKGLSFTTEQVNVLKSSHRVRPLLDALAQAYDPRVTRPQELKLRSFAVLAKANWDQDTLKGHREGIQSTLGQWGAFTFDPQINDAAQALKTAFLSRPHANLGEELGKLNTRILANKPIDLAIRYEKETNFTGSPSFEDWAKRPENQYNAKVNGLDDSSLFKAALKKPKVKKAFLDRHEKIGGGDFDVKFQALTDGLQGKMGDYSREKQAQFFEEFILSQKDHFNVWLLEKEDAVAKLALEEYTKNQSEIFKRVFEDEDFKEFIVRKTRGPNFEDNQKRVFDGMNHFIRSQTELLLAKATTIDAVAQELRDLAGQEDFWS